ncbi:unnamed protein product [Nesidiocoris tenuis]|uniref:Uncharacterized protein n=1 Tax=Nesidiocoris tenuis TaxID=355587 RepID=A0A6H5H800_9HEMI|nr:unnamed protein product [Nesidiocoris tenuis]
MARRANAQTNRPNPLVLKLSKLHDHDHSEDPSSIRILLENGEKDGEWPQGEASNDGRDHCTIVFISQVRYQASPLLRIFLNIWFVFSSDWLIVTGDQVAWADDLALGDQRCWDHPQYFQREGHLTIWPGLKRSFGCRLRYWISGRQSGDLDGIHRGSRARLLNGSALYAARINRTARPSAPPGRPFWPYV